ncbi:MAG: DUF1538 domain-containing protein [Proteobacteria bacterium]|nr:DUF1538 domain-containing protein [Pseudomonadota bacterium]MDA1132271.1 DUF1538 domain-containing protein [Pseudomonadota bacterium]
MSQIRYGEFLRGMRSRQTVVSYNELTRGGPAPQQKLKLRAIDVERLLAPYLGTRFYEQVRTVVPLALYLMLFQLLILRQDVADIWVIVAGFGAVIIGLMLFMEGLKLGMMPFAEIIGNKLPKKSALPVVLFIVFLLGIGVTLAEPAIGALQAVGSIVEVTRAPYLYELLNNRAGTLVLVVGIGVGCAAVLGTIRFLRGWSLKPLIFAALVPTLGLVLYIMWDPELSKTLGLAWDSGAVTTGPVTVPLVLALGIGIASAAGKGSSSLSGFGIVTLASLFPIVGVMLLSLYVGATTDTQTIIATAQAAQQAGDATWLTRTPVAEIIGGIRAIVPLMAFLFLILFAVLREKLAEAGIVTYGITLALIGMIVFNVGLTYGLAKLGSQSGGLVAGAFAEVGVMPGSPLYSVGVGVMIALVFAWALGFGATLAEPALNALGLTVENLTNGAFKKRTLMYAVSVGVAFGIAVGILKIVLDIPLAWLILPGYAAAVLLTILSSEEFVNVAWDSAGVTTGPVTVPLVLAMGLGFGNAVDAIEGFGILSMASIGPILTVMATGLWVQRTAARRAALRGREAEQPARQGQGVAA